MCITCMYRFLFWLPYQRLGSVGALHHLSSVSSRLLHDATRLLPKRHTKQIDCYDARLPELLNPSASQANTPCLHNRFLDAAVYAHCPPCQNITLTCESAVHHMSLRLLQQLSTYALTEAKHCTVVCPYILGRSISSQSYDLAVKDKIILKGLSFFGFHGVLPEASPSRLTPAYAF